MSAGRFSAGVEAEPGIGKLTLADVDGLDRLREAAAQALVARNEPTRYGGPPFSLRHFAYLAAEEAYKEALIKAAPALLALARAPARSARSLSG